MLSIDADSLADLTLNCGVGSFTLAQVLDFASAYELTLGGKYKPGTQLLLRPLSKLDGFIRSLGLWRLGLVPVFDDRRLDVADSFLLEVAPPFKFSRKQSLVGASDFFAFMHSDQAALGFLTSGSTGAPKLVEKRWCQLISELTTLNNLYKIAPGGHIVSFVSPFHIYGFLHCFLLPLACQAHIHFFEYENGIYDVNWGEFVGPIDLLVTVPATWEFVKNLSLSMAIDQMVSSGGAFGEERQRQSEELATRPRRLFEIMGSTETGGIGYREIGIGFSQSFKLFPGVSLTQNADQTEIISPHMCSDGGPLPLDDRLELLEGEQFLHLGRTDQIFKLSGQRYSLAQVERNLATVLGRIEIKCLFRTDNSPKGGELLAFIEGSEPAETILELRQKYMQRFTTPCPNQIIYLAVFPRDGNGKVQVDFLESLKPQPSKP